MKNRRNFFKKALVGSAFLGFSALSLRADESLKDDFKQHLKESDPEFNEIFSNFLKEVEQKSEILSQKQRAVSILGALIATQSSFIKDFLKANLNKNINAVEVKEVLYQSVAYVGFGRAFSAIKLINESFKELNIKLPLAKQGTTNRKNRFEKGLELQISMFGEAIKRANAAASADTRHIREFLNANCFGDYYTRVGLI